MLKPFVANVQDKLEASDRGERYWKGSAPLRLYGRARSEQLFERDRMKVEETDDGFSCEYNGSIGISAVITSDGYALTAKHVLEETGGNAVIGQPGRGQRLHAVTIMTRKDANSPWRTEGLAGRAFPSKPVGKKEARPALSPVRIVYTFPDRDLAIIKLPAAIAPRFELRGKVSEDEWIFASGNGVGMSPGSTAGQVVVQTGPGEWLTTMPAAPGDSGGPVMDSRGRLVGILTHTTGGSRVEGRGMRVLQSSLIQVPEKAKIEALIREDRRRMRSR